MAVVLVEVAAGLGLVAFTLAACSRVDALCVALGCRLVGGGLSGWWSPTVDLGVDEAAEDFGDVFAVVEALLTECSPGVVVDLDAGGLLLEAGPPVAC